MLILNVVSETSVSSKLFKISYICKGTKYTTIADEGMKNRHIEDMLCSADYSWYKVEVIEGEWKPVVEMRREWNRV